MNFPTPSRLHRRIGISALLGLSLALLCDARVTAEPPAGAAPPAPPPPLTAQQLDELVAPVALYPDVVLNSLLPATTVPADVAAAVKLVGEQGGAVTTPPPDADWDPSVVALLQFPDVLRWVGENPAWLERMGFAVYTQQADVLAAIQRYRAKARAAGVLVSDEHQTVVVERGAAPIVVIEPAVPEVVYVPSYDPWLLFGSYVYSPGVPFYSSWFGFSFGISGLWCRHRIFWGFGIYDYGSPWWWGRWRSPAYDWGPGRPTRWYAPHHADPHWSHPGWKGSSSGAVRPDRPHFGSSGMSGRKTGFAPTPRMYGPSTRPPTISGGGGVTTRSKSWSGQPSSPAAPVTRWSGGKATTGPRTLPPTALPKTSLPPGGLTIPRTVAPTPKVYDRGTVSGWSGRGRSSLSGGTRTVAPAPAIRPMPRVVSPPSTPRWSAPSRVMPPSRSRGSSIPSGSRTHSFSNRGNKSLRSR